MGFEHEFYQGADPRDFPQYGVAEAARAIDQAPRSTLRTWCAGDNPVITPADLHPMTLSFNNLLEARVLRALRVTHKVQMVAIREALEEAEHELGVDRLLLHQDLRTDGASLLIKYYGEYTHLNPSKQIAMRKVLESSLSRVEWDADHFARRFYPSFAGDQKIVFLDPLCKFGQAVVSKRFISTRVIHGRIAGGEKPRAIARDYGITMREVEQAVVYEEAA